MPSEKEKKAIFKFAFCVSIYLQSSSWLGTRDTKNVCEGGYLLAGGYPPFCIGKGVGACDFSPSLFHYLWTCKTKESKNLLFMLTNMLYSGFTYRLFWGHEGICDLTHIPEGPQTTYIPHNYFPPVNLVHPRCFCYIRGEYEFSHCFPICQGLLNISPQNNKGKRVMWSITLFSII